MGESKPVLTYSAMEKALLHGLYMESTQNQAIEAQYQSAVARFFSQNSRRQRIKAKLKKNRLIYGCWQKYKIIQGQGVSSMNNDKLYKHFRAFRYLDNLIHMPGRIRDLNTLLSISTSVSEKCDYLCREIEDLGKHERMLEAILESSNVEIKTLLTGVHEKIDSANIAIQQTKAACKTVVSTNVVSCVQYDWNLFVGVPASDWRLAMYLSAGGHFEYGTELLFRKTVKQGMNVLDLGANVGIYTLHGLRCGASVYSFEPTPSTFQILKQNTALNGYEYSPMVHLYNYAVSDHAGSVSFTEINGVCGQNNMFSSDEEGSTIEVQTVKLDDLLKDITIDCFKMDIEGAEMLALRGMEELLARSPSICGFVEFAPPNLLRANVDPKDYFDCLRNLGFNNIWKINEENGELTPIISYEEIQAETSINLYIKKAE